MITISALDFLKTYQDNWPAYLKFANQHDLMNLEDLVLDGEVLPKADKIADSTKKRWKGGAKPPSIRQLDALAAHGFSLPMDQSDPNFETIVALATYVFFKGSIEDSYTVGLTVPPWHNITDQEYPFEGLDDSLSRLAANNKSNEKAIHSYELVAKDGFPVAPLGRLLKSIGLSNGSRTYRAHTLVMPVKKALSYDYADITEKYFERWAILRGYMERESLIISFPLDIIAAHQKGISSINPGIIEHEKLLKEVLPNVDYNLRMGESKSGKYIQARPKFALHDASKVFAKFPSLEIHKDRPSWVSSK